MPELLKKRKRGDVDAGSSMLEDNSSNSNVVVKDAFKRAFEARFAPLVESSEEQIPTIIVDPAASAYAVDQSAEDDWSGFSSENESQDAGVEVVEHSNFSRTPGLSKVEAKTFMNSKPPLSSTTSMRKPNETNQRSIKNSDIDDDEFDLKNDLALQRLIEESHLLDPRKAPASREKITEARLRSLGVKSSTLQQEKMPMSHRIGIANKRAVKEQRRRLEARENGIVLEKQQRKATKRENRDRGVGEPSVGRFKGGTLSLSKRDVALVKGAPAQARKMRR